MRSYKFEFHRHEMFTDHKATGEMKQKLQKRVRCQLKRKAKKEIEDPNFERRPIKKDR